jgi:DNA-binding beta-propeller fold protein YncE
MRRLILTVVSLLGFAPAVAAAHPGTGIVIDRFGNVYFVDMVSGVWKADTHGALTHLAGPAFHWLALDESGALGAANLPHGPTGDIVRLGAEPTLILSSDVPIAIGRDGSLYYPSRGAPLRLVRMRPSGTSSVVATLPASGGLRELNGVAVGPNGSLYYTENDAIRRIDPDGRLATVSQHVAPARCASIQGIERKDQPLLRGLAADPAGVVYVAATGCGSVLKVTAAGEVTTLFQGDGEWSPTGVALSGSDVYVLEFRGAGSDDRHAMVPRIRKIAAGGATEVIATVRR